MLPVAGYQLREGYNGGTHGNDPMTPLAGQKILWQATETP